jgi:glutaminase
MKMKKITYSLTLAVLVALAGLCTTLQAQPQRTSHEQVKRLIERIEQGTDVFRDSLKDALDKSRLDDTRREDNINQFVKEFEQATDRLKDRYGDNNTAVATVEEVLRRGTFIDNFVERHWLSQRAQRDWRNVYRNLNDLARAYGVGWDWSSPASNPYRISQEAMKGLLERIEKHSDNFRASLDDALDKSRFDGSKREDNINNFVKDFEVATDNLKDRFDDDYSAVGAASEVLRRGAMIDHFMQRHALTPRAQSDWAALRTDLDELARAYNVSMSWKNWTITIP